jgi:hypothetical protein
MKKNLFAWLTVAAVAGLLAACGGSSRVVVSTSTRADLSRSVRYIPSLANLQVQAERATATCTASELEGLKGESAKQAVVAKALTATNADVLIAARFTTEKGSDGKMISMSVVGYPATITGFRSLAAADAPFSAVNTLSQNRVSSRMALNTMTVAEVEYGAKQTISLTLSDLGSKNEKQAVAFAKEKMMRDLKVDLLYEPQYKAVIDGSTVSSITLTAFPAKYVNYRTATKAEMEALSPESKPVVYYNLTADIQPVHKRIQAKVNNTDAAAKESELKEQAREAALAKYNADFLLNEQFYVDREDKVITRVTICGTPAVYANFRPLSAGDVIDFRQMKADGGEAGDEEEQPQGFLGIFQKLFKKK